MGSTLTRPFCFICSFLVLICSACGSRSDPTGDREKILEQGAALYQQYTCITCHSLDGQEIYGPPLNGLYLKNVEVVRNGQILTLKADRDYLRRAITDPRFEEVKGYESKDMPEVFLGEEEIELLVDYLVLMGQNDTAREKDAAANSDPLP